MARDEWHPHSYPWRPEVQDQLARAQRERYRIKPCAICGGPELFSKQDLTLSRCLRCGQQRRSAIARPKVSFRRCACCGEQTMTGRPLAKSYCLTCDGLSNRQRRWRREKTAQKTSIKSGVD